MRHASAALVLALLAACGEDPTEIVLEVRSDLVGLEEVSARATRDAGGAMEARAVLAGAPLPRTLVLRHEGGALGPVRVTVAGHRSGATVVERVLVVRFQQGRSLRLVVELLEACRAVACEPGRTCARGGCRSEEVAPCELEPSGCPPSDGGPPPTDAGDDGGRDAGPGDGGADASPPDGSVPCPLGAGLCGLGTTRAPGDLVRPRSCADPAGASVEITAEGPGGAPLPTAPGSTPSRPAFRLPEAAGAYTFRASVAAIPGCMASGSVSLALFGSATGGAGAPGANASERRDMDARVGGAFFATKVGPWAAGRTGWRDLRVGAAGTLPPNDLQTVAVWRGGVFFGARGDADALAQADVPGDLSSATFTPVPMPAGSREVRGMDAPHGGARDYLAVATKDGLLVVEGPAGAVVARPAGPAYDANVGVAGGTVEAEGRTALWGFQPDELVNAARASSSAPLNAGSAVATAAGALAAARVADTIPGRMRLVLCSADRGVETFDLDADWSGLTTLPTALGTQAGACRDLDTDEAGDAWALVGANLLRIGADGAAVAVLGAAQGVPLDAAQVAVAWDAAAREVWLLGTDGSVRVLASDLAD